MAHSNSAFPSDTGHDIFKGMTEKKKAKESKKAPRQQVQLGEHGRYQIKSGLLAGKFVARAFPKAPSAKPGLIAEADGATEEAAIAALHALIDARETQRTDARRTDAQTGQSVPGIEEFMEAIGQVALTAPQRTMLMALALAGEEGLAETRMASAGGYKSQTSAKRSLAGAGQSMVSYLAAGAGVDAAVPGTEGLSLLGFQEEPQEDQPAGNWVLHPELREAVRAVL